MGVRGIKKAPSFVFILAEACTLTNPMLLLLGSSGFFLQIPVSPNCMHKIALLKSGFQIFLCINMHLFLTDLFTPSESEINIIHKYIHINNHISPSICLFKISAIHFLLHFLRDHKILCPLFSQEDIPVPKNYLLPGANTYNLFHNLSSS